MSGLQATWIPEQGALFWWSPDPTIGDEPAGLELRRRPEERARLVDPTSPGRTRAVVGRRTPVGEVLASLVGTPADALPSDSARVWRRAALTAVDLARRGRVSPRIQGERARWIAALHRYAERQAVEAIAEALPLAAIVWPVSTSPITVPARLVAVRDFIDAAVDALYRSGAYPGTARGWPLALADALRAGDGRLQLRDARQQAIPRRLAAWSEQGARGGLAVGLRLSLPASGAGKPTFELAPVVHLPDTDDRAVPASLAWEAGPALLLHGRRLPHPAEQTVRGMARMARLVPRVSTMLVGPAPHPIALDPDAAWSFLSTELPRLSHAGFRVDLPEGFQASGAQRLRARLRVLGPERGPLGATVPTRWEVLIGERVLPPVELSSLIAQRRPLVQHQGTWVLLDPEALARLPAGLDAHGSLSAPEALLAVLVGEHRGVEVVADARMAALLENLRHPPEIAPPPGLNATLRPYQRRGIAWLHTLSTLGLGAVLADDMGLGKTLQVLGWLLLQLPRATAPFLVVCPTSLLNNWEREAARFAPDLTFTRYHGATRELETLKPGTVLLTTHGLLARDADALQAVFWQAVILDEAQAIKNPDSQRARAARALQAHTRLALTGTPVENRLDELWSIFAFVMPGLLGPRARFQREVAVPVERLGDAEAATRLKKGVAPFLLRRMKTDPTVIDDLPEKIERTVYATLTREQATLYEQVAEEGLLAVEGQDGVSRRGAILAMLTRLKQVCNHPAQLLGDASEIEGRSGKLVRLAELLDTVFAQGERALVFTQFRVMGELLQAWIKERFGIAAPFLHGGVSVDAREAMVSAFQTQATAPPVLLISLKAGGTGLNLTRATHVIHYDRWWNPAVEDQATDRAFRIGQRERVLVHKLLTVDSLEERIDALLTSKRALVDQVVGSGETWIGELDDQALRALVLRGARDPHREA